MTVQDERSLKITKRYHSCGEAKHHTVSRTCKTNDCMKVERFYITHVDLLLGAQIQQKQYRNRTTNTLLCSLDFSFSLARVATGNSAYKVITAAVQRIPIPLSFPVWTRLWQRYRSSVPYFFFFLLMFPLEISSWIYKLLEFISLTPLDVWPNKLIKNPV